MAASRIVSGAGLLLGFLGFLSKAASQPGVPVSPKTDPDGFGAQFLIDLNPPVPERLFRFESEDKFKERLRNEKKDVRFPPTRPAAPEYRPIAREGPLLVVSPEPGSVCYKRLWFEQKNSERYGWDLGVIHPVVAAGVFYTDLALLPLHWIINPCRCFDCSAGQCLPGEPVPFLWNPLISK